MNELDRYEEIKELIEKFANDYGYCESEDDDDYDDEDFDDFEDLPIVNFDEGIDEKIIEAGEKFLGYELSPSYKWWLRNYGGGDICGEEIYGLYYEEYNSEDTSDVVDIIHRNNLQRKKGFYSQEQLKVCVGDDEQFYFDISKKDEKTGEYPIYEYFSQTLYAKDFIEFLKKRISIFN